jgi:hypothetical protein
MPMMLKPVHLCGERVPFALKATQCGDRPQRPLQRWAKLQAQGRGEPRWPAWVARRREFRSPFSSRRRRPSKRLRSPAAVWPSRWPMPGVAAATSRSSALQRNARHLLSRGFCATDPDDLHPACRRHPASPTPLPQPTAPRATARFRRRILCWAALRSGRTLLRIAPPGQDCPKEPRAAAATWNT